ncbi:MAG TPA: RimK family protein [Paucimonas sp.]|nr:RimK family protein [Paucimonas sp.]
MNILFVVSHPRDWPIPLPGVQVAPARAYLTDARYGDCPDTKVFNLCKSYRYQKRGYYVSLLGEARGHKPIPDMKAIEDLQSDHLLQLTMENLGESIQLALADVVGHTFTLNAYFGRDPVRRHEQLAEQLFNLLHIPLLRVRFARHEQHQARWSACAIQTIGIGDIPPGEWAALTQAASECLQAHRQRDREPAAKRPSLAVLHTPGHADEPSNPGALRKFQEAAEQTGMRMTVITKDDLARLPQFDALFIRDTTNANHYTYQFSRQATLAGLVVIDDPDSILKCNNKVYLAELLGRHGIPMPKTLLVHRDNMDRIVPELGLPVVLKQPDSAFSMGVTKAETVEELAQRLEELLGKSELVLAQEYLPTEFDWRIGILDRKPLFACKYFMVPGHWQIVQHGNAYREGPTEAVAIEDAPPQVIETALAAAGLIGDGFYGVDLKQRGQHCYVIEINDNPNVDAGNEDGVLKDALYRAVMDVFRARIEARKGSAAP